MEKSLLRKFCAAAIVFSLIVFAGCSPDKCKKSDKAQAKPAPCSQSKQSDVKQSKPAATGNIDLKKQIVEKDAEIAKLKGLLEQKDKEIAQIKSDNEKEIKSLGEEIMNSLVDSGKLKEENESLKKQIEELKKSIGK